MSTINVFPANQGFPRPPDGGVVSTSPSKDVKVIPQAFAPAPLVNPFPIPPTPPPTPFLPATQGVPPVAVLAEVIPFNPLSVDVDLMKVDSTAGDAPTYTISDAGSFAIVPGPAVRFYTIISVIDLDTGAAPTTSSVNLKITMSGGSAPPLGLPLDSYGFTFAGRSLLFAAGAWIPAQTTPERIIAVNGDLLNGDSIVIVPNLDPDGNSRTQRDDFHQRTLSRLRGYSTFHQNRPAGKKRCANWRFVIDSLSSSSRFPGSIA